MILEPSSDKIIIRSMMQDRTGLIWHPPIKMEEMPIEGVVVAIGPDVVEHAWIHPGDIIVYGKYAGTPVADLKNGYMICESDIKYKKVLEEFDTKEGN